MSLTPTEVGSKRRGRPRRWATLAIACLMASGASTIVAGTATAQASVRARSVTRAAIAPSLTAGRGADVPFVEQEAENAVTNGTIIGPSTQAYTLAAEASGRSAVSLAPGQYVQFTLPKRRERNQRALQHSGLSHGRWHHGATGCRSQRQLPPNHDAHVTVLVALRSVSVRQ